MTEEKHNPSTLWTGNFIKIIVVNFFIFFSFHMLLPTLPIFVKSIGGQDSIVGLITGLFTISALLIRPFAGLLLDRIGRRSIFWTGLALFILATFSYSLFTAVTLVLLFRFIHGFGWGAASTSSTTIATDNIPRKRFGEGMGYTGLASSLAMAVGPATGIVLISALGFDALFYVSTLLAIVAFLISMFIRYRRVEKVAAPSRRAVLFEPTALKPTVLIFFMTTSYGTIVSFLSLYAAEKGIANIGIYFTVNALALLVSRPFIGRMIDRFGLEKTLLPGLALLLFSTLLLSQAGSLGVFLLVALLYGIGFGAAQSSLQAMSLLGAPTHRVGAANATFMTGFDSGIGVGSILFGIIASAIGYEWMYILAALPLLLSAALFFLPGSKGKQKAEPAP